MRTRTPIARRGMTLAELVIGTAMLGIVLMAASGLMSAVAAGWKSGSDSFRQASIGGRAGASIEDELSRMLYALKVRAPAGTDKVASIFYWRHDGFGGHVDGKPQLGEVALIEYDPATKSIWLYRTIQEANMTPAQQTAAAVSDWGDMSTYDVASYFKQQSFVAPRTLLVGAQGVSDVTAATFESFSPAGAKPMMIYALEMNTGGLVSSTRGAVTLRGSKVPRLLPGAPPAGAT